MDLWGDALDAIGRIIVAGITSGHILSAVLLIVIAYLLSQKSYDPEKKPLSKKEIEELCAEWKPEPLHEPITDEMKVKRPTLESAAAAYTTVNGHSVLNLASANYLGFVGNEKIRDTCTAALQKYGVGSCGPRGFYGTIDVHLQLEAKIAAFMGTPDSILYALGLATASSVIPAFVKQGDLIIADEGVHWGIRTGLNLSRSTIQYFKHNDMTSLETLLENVIEEDQRKKKNLNRRFIVVEAIYQNSGKMAPLDEIIRLKEKYKFRVFVDETNSLGVLGTTGRGLSDHFNIPVQKVDIITAGMGSALASAGGFCTASLKIVDHQRLSASGYVFSASLPPYLASASIAAIDLLRNNPQLISQLRRNIDIFNRCLTEIPSLQVGSDPLSPMVFIHLAKSRGSFKEDSAYLQKIVDRMLDEHKMLMSVAKRSPLDECKLPAGIRVCISAGHSEADMLLAGAALKTIANEEALNSFVS